MGIVYGFPAFVESVKPPVALTYGAYQPANGHLASDAGERVGKNHAGAVSAMLLSNTSDHILTIADISPRDAGATAIYQYAYADVAGGALTAASFDESVNVAFALQPGMSIWVAVGVISDRCMADPSLCADFNVLLNDGATVRVEIPATFDECTFSVSSPCGRLRPIMMAALESRTFSQQFCSMAVEAQSALETQSCRPN